MDQLSRPLADLFWAKIEALAPASRTCESAPISTDSGARHWDGRKQRVEFEHILRSVRFFYTDLHSWTSGETVTVNGRAYQRVWTAADDRRARRGGQANLTSATAR